MSLTIYSFSGSPCAWRVMLGMVFKKLDFDIRTLNLSEREHRSEHYLKINPRGTVPTLLANGLTLRDSIAILAWLDRAYPDTPLFGNTLDEVAHIWQTTMDSSEYMQRSNKGLLMPIFFQGATHKTDALIQAATSVRGELERLEDLLAGNDFVAGMHVSAADAVCFPEARMFKRALDTHRPLMSDLGFQPELPDFPKLAQWIHRIEGSEGVEKTMPGHWA